METGSARPIREHLAYGPSVEKHIPPEGGDRMARGASAVGIPLGQAKRMILTCGFECSADEVPRAEHVILKKSRWHTCNRLHSKFS